MLPYTPRIVNDELVVRVLRDQQGTLDELITLIEENKIQEEMYSEIIGRIVSQLKWVRKYSNFN